MRLPILQLTLLRAPTHPSSPHRPPAWPTVGRDLPGPDHSIYHAIDQVAASTAIAPLTLLRAQGAQSSYICRFMGGEGVSERQRDFSEVTQQSGSQAGLTQRPGSTPHCGAREWASLQSPGLQLLRTHSWDLPGEQCLPPQPGRGFSSLELPWGTFHTGQWG